MFQKRMLTDYFKYYAIKMFHHGLVLAGYGLEPAADVQCVTIAFYCVTLQQIVR